MDVVLVVNAGSSSLKFQVFEAGEPDALVRLAKGLVEGVGTRPRLRTSAPDPSLVVDRAYAAEDIPDLPTALRTAADWLHGARDFDLVAVGHRVVHGGPTFADPILLTDEVLSVLEHYVPLAPLHQPNNLAPIRALRVRRPDLPQVACFDTAFHRRHGAHADHFAIPRALYEEGVRRYGFHGLSYEYVAERLRTVAPEIALGRVIVAHLGSGASMCAMSEGRSVESTMGFTGLDGLPMGTRPGQLDPGVLLYLMSNKGMDVERLERFLYKECGLAGLSGQSSDMRDLEESSSEAAAFAIEHFVHRIALSAGMLAAALGGIDAFVFTAGIGENSARLRARVTARLAWLGAILDIEANARHALRISTPDSRFPVLVVPTDEEAMIAAHTMSLLRANTAGGHAERRAS